MKISTRYWIKIQKEHPTAMYHSKTGTITLSFINGDGSLVLEMTPEKCDEVIAELSKMRGRIEDLYKEIKNGTNH